MTGGLVEASLSGALVIDRTTGKWGDAHAVFDAERRYRYSLTRVWGPPPWRACLMLNPSTADAFKVDATITRCLIRAQAAGFGGLVVVNLFALRSRFPTDLLPVDDPVGPYNDEMISTMPAEVASQIIVGWGCGPSGKRGREMVAARARAVCAALDGTRFEMASLQVNADGSPKHPLYCKTEDVPTPWRPR